MVFLLCSDGLSVGQRTRRRKKGCSLGRQRPRWNSLRPLEPMTSLRRDWGPDLHGVSISAVRPARGQRDVVRIDLLARLGLEPAARLRLGLSPRAAGGRGGSGPG